MKENPANIKALRAAIPERCFTPSLRLSLSYLGRDLFLVGLLGAIALQIPSDTAKFLNFVLWNVYGFLQGLVCTGLWIIAHECGHGAFSRFPIFNDIVGWTLHSFLFVPYFSWKISHHQHHMYTGNMDKDTAFVPTRREEVECRDGGKETWRKWMDHLPEDAPVVTALQLLGHQLLGFPLYYLFNVSAGNKSNKRGQSRSWLNASHYDPGSVIFRAQDQWKVLVSDFGLICTLSLLWWASSSLGGWTVFQLYWVPYLWVNHWLVAITYLHHTHPSVTYYESESWTFRKGAVSTVDRDFGWIGRNLFHQIIEHHVVHHLFPRIPFYYACEATEAIRPLLGDEYKVDRSSFLRSLWNSFRALKCVEAQRRVGDGGLVRVWS